MMVINTIHCNTIDHIDCMTTIVIFIMEMMVHCDGEVNPLGEDVLVHLRGRSGKCQHLPANFDNRREVIKNVQRQCLNLMSTEESSEMRTPLIEGGHGLAKR